ncbi:chromate efflux transporter [Pseudomonas vanderleydeniana]|uniref:Chromate efflux transporter n=1 Tax=Pseudomonas vanderleydeniana TaxID=2745495 RepID=A0A9E6PI31_9PSED|nr:chromate efflux transporter [Pseudomonas vanderleydeniana]QXI26792.1 chromate efflux transporter [Pseudomonas vanderleydeniana]
MSQQEHSANSTRAWAVFLIFLRLGLTSFGGPIAHLGFFRLEFVQRRGWLSEPHYAELIALCQFLPGPASSQVGMALGLYRAGVPGALAAWAGFTLPSALLLSLFALGIGWWGAALPAGLLHGLKIVAVAVVAQALFGMAKSLSRGLARAVITLVAAWVVLSWDSVPGQLLVMLAAAGVGVLLLAPPVSVAEPGVPVPVRRAVAWAALLLFFLLLLGGPLVAGEGSLSALFASFYRTGALVFGGGHVVLPLLEQAVVGSGRLDGDTFLAGYAAAQAVPGPLFTFAAFVGAAIDGVTGALVCLVAIFLPSLLLVVGVLPFWPVLRGSPRVLAALAGVNAAVVGLLLAAFWRPLWSSAILGPLDFGLAVLALLALVVWRWAPWVVVLAGALAGLVLL